MLMLSRGLKIIENAAISHEIFAVLRYFSGHTAYNHSNQA
jgi:hypothetical protein